MDNKKSTSKRTGYDAVERYRAIMALLFRELFNILTTQSLGSITCLRRFPVQTDVDAEKTSCEGSRIPNRVQTAQQGDLTEANRYPVNGPGFLLIINFSKDREGSQEDVRALRDFFGSDLGFEVQEMNDLDKDELIRRLDALQRSLYGKYYCFVCVVMAHGNENGFTTNNGQISYTEVIHKFDNTCMKQMAGKPKLFIINTCRVKTNVSVTNGTDSSPSANGIPQKYAYEHSDVAVYYSTVSGYVSWRNEKTGSTFIQKSVEVFKARCSSQDINDMTKQINLAVQEASCQVPTLEDRLIKKLFFEEYGRID